ncbi:YidC/Oxa1 family membrane protein insertase [Chloroflexota bacterium]
MEIWNTVLLNPILNFLILLSSIFFSNFGLAIIALTIIVRLVILPLTLKQYRASKKMSEGMRELQPKLQQIQKKYAKNRAKLQQETMKLYKEAGINPLGCLTSPMLVTMIIQMPIFFAVYRAVIQGVASTPQDFLGLSEHLYSWSIVQQALPVSSKFLWLDLASPDPYFIIPLLVMGLMWVSQKMMAKPSVDPKQQSMQNMMQLMIPLMFGFITFTLPSGLGLYFVTTFIDSIIIQYFVYGWGNVLNRAPESQVPQKTVTKIEKQVAEVTKSKKQKEEVTTGGETPNQQEGKTHGKYRSKR